MEFFIVEFVPLTVGKLLKVTNTRSLKDGAVFILFHGNGLTNLLQEEVMP